MRKIKTLLMGAILVASTLSAKAQDAKAKTILDKLSKKTESYTSMHADFEYKMLNKEEGINETQKGSLLTQGKKYKFDIAGQVIISDGKTVWTVLEDAEEVQINEVPQGEDNEDYINPVSILTMWEKGFKYKYDSKVTLDGVELDVVNLYPEKPDEKSFHTVKLYINQTKMVVSKIEIKGKDGTDFTYNIKTFTPNESIAPSKFTFKQADHPDFEVIDLR
ncbi:MAG: outer membrane lipoprotein carrier protein LolA [Bacteroidetes bacterium]|nr:outer membrane lipoprotein carrier protein LolA [Bacteroidota bacterium]